MSETKFTPGPWAVEFPQDARKPAIVRASDQVVVARVTLNGANAHLMAAAPDLYAACLHAESVMMLVMPPSLSGKYHEAWKVVKAALAKARGETDG